jgi:hypothetical protein
MGKRLEGVRPDGERRRRACDGEHGRLCVSFTRARKGVLVQHKRSDALTTDGVAAEAKELDKAVERLLRGSNVSSEFQLLEDDAPAHLLIVRSFTTPSQPPCPWLMTAKFTSNLLMVLLGNPGIWALTADLGLDPCLLLLIDTLVECKFSRKPYKWIRYATGPVIGTYGNLSANQHSPTPIVNYEDGCFRPGSLHYHMDDIEERRMFPLDSIATRNPLSTSSEETTRRCDFRDDLVERDGRCILTQRLELRCAHVHLLPYCKGDEVRPCSVICCLYLHLLDILVRRNVRDIDNSPNGVLLLMDQHPILGKAFALLVVRSFLLT